MVGEEEIDDIFKKIKKANKKASKLNLNTPIVKSRYLSGLVSADVYLKLENFQITGSFKIRGAFNKLQELGPEQIQNGVITASAGNHGQGLAYAARIMNVPATIVVPENTPFIKIKRIKNQGALVVEKGQSYDDAVEIAQKLAIDKKMVYIPAFDDPDIIAGQGVIGLEIMDYLEDPLCIICPIGGGGLISGIAIFAKHIVPEIKIIGVEAYGAAAMKYSVEKGKITTLEIMDTIADGIAVKTPGNLTFNIVSELVDDIVTVNDNQIANAILKLMEEDHIVVEGAGATPVAALLNDMIPELEGKKVVCIISGGNIDVTMLDKIIDKGLVFDNRFMSVDCNIPDKPGNLVKLLEVIAGLKGNVLDIRHHRRGANVQPGYSRVVIDLEIRNAEHAGTIKKKLKDEGYCLL
ncbi:MAG: threonine ammonia-lyase [Candidatus Hodarchaeota archaeon]